MVVVVVVVVVMVIMVVVVSVMAVVTVVVVGAEVSVSRIVEENQHDVRARCGGGVISVAVPRPLP